MWWQQLQTSLVLILCVVCRHMLCILFIYLAQHLYWKALITYWPIHSLLFACLGIWAPNVCELKFVWSVGTFQSWRNCVDDAFTNVAFICDWYHKRKADYIHFSGLETFSIAGALVWSLHDITSTQGNSRFMWFSILLKCV